MKEKKPCNCTLGGFRHDVSYHKQVPVGLFIVKFAASEHLKKVTGKIFAISTVSDFKKQAETFFKIFFRKRHIKSVKSISAHSKITVLQFKTFKQIFIL
jgi:hypothetical protein